SVGLNPLTSQGVEADCDSVTPSEASSPVVTLLVTTRARGEKEISEVVLGKRLLRKRLWRLDGRAASSGPERFRPRSVHERDAPRTRALALAVTQSVHLFARPEDGHAG